MNLHDMRAGGGGPRCVGDEASFFWSGGGLEIADVRAGGAARIDAHDDETGWPAWERARCLTCRAVWHFDFQWHDHPPLLLTGTVVAPGTDGTPENRRG